MRYLVMLFALVVSAHLAAQPVLFSKCYGGPGNDDRCYSTIDAPPGVVMSGRVNSSGGDVTGFHGTWDAWVVRTDAVGAITWAKCYGGAGEETIMRTILTSDGYLLHVGFSTVIDGDVTSNYGSSDYWVIKTDMMGNIQWQKSYGGSVVDCAYDAVDLGDGTYVVGGVSFSNDGLITGHHGSTNSGDMWMIKIDAQDGHLIWERSYGGTGAEGVPSNYRYFRLMSLISYDDSTLAFTISTNSQDGDISNAGLNATEFWLVKTDTAGAILFENTYGGSLMDISYNLVKAPDNGLVVVGASTSNDGDVTGHHGTSPGAYDYWIMKTDLTGALQWQRSCGGTQYEDGFGICATSQGYYITGRSESFNGDVQNSGWHGGQDYWVAFLDYNGVLMWDRCFGGTGFEEGYEVLVTSDGKLTLCGYAGSNDGDVMNQHGGFDFWLVKLDDVTGSGENREEDATLHAYPNPGTDRVWIAGADSRSTIEIYSASGQFIHTVIAPDGSVDCTGLLPGMYVFLVYSDDQLKGSTKWVKQ